MNADQLAALLLRFMVTMERDNQEGELDSNRLHDIYEDAAAQLPDLHRLTLNHWDDTEAGWDDITALPRLNS